MKQKKNQNMEFEKGMNRVDYTTAVALETEWKSSLQHELVDV